jgi:hypothetical protein
MQSPRRSAIVRSTIGVVLMTTGLAAIVGRPLAAQAQDIGGPGVPAPPLPPSLEEAQRLFYAGAYPESIAMAGLLRSQDTAGLAAYELRTSALHFQIRRALGYSGEGDSADRDQAMKTCAVCPDLIRDFMSDIASGRALAKSQLEKTPQDEQALFFLGKIDLNYVWLQLGTMGKKTGWGEYWEARRSLDAVLKANPGHTRASVARAWIDYIVDTRMPRGFRWVLGGGNKKRALTVMREAANSNADFFTKTEAAFALWDVAQREKDLTTAVETARKLRQDFPENKELTRFLDKHAAGS